MESIMKTGDYGSECVNFICDKDGLLKRSELNTNAVIVSLFPDFDDEGNKIYKKFVSISCVDEDMLEPLKKEAHRIIYGHLE